MLLKTAFRGGFFIPKYHDYKCKNTFNYMNTFNNNVRKEGRAQQKARSYTMNGLFF